MGRESVIAASELFFKELNFNRIELHINVDNEPSKKLALSTGFNYECTREAFSYEDGKWTDFLNYYKKRVYKEDIPASSFSGKEALIPVEKNE